MTNKVRKSLLHGCQQYEVRNPMGRGDLPSEKEKNYAGPRDCIQACPSGGSKAGWSAKKRDTHNKRENSGSWKHHK